MRISHQPAIGATVLLCLHLAGSVGDAQQPKNKNGKNDEARENQAVREAQQVVTETQKEIAERQEDVRKELTVWKDAQRDRDRAAKRREEIEDQLHARHAEKSGLNAAKEVLSKAREALANRSQPILETLKQDAKFQAAEKAAAETKQRMQRTFEDPEDRKVAIANHRDSWNKLRELEQAALQSDLAIKPLQDQVDQAGRQVEQAKKRAERLFDADPEWKAAQSSFENARKAEDRAEEAIAAARRRLAMGQQQLQQATLRLRQAQTRDAADPNRKKPAKKKPSR